MLEGGLLVVLVVEGGLLVLLVGDVLVATGVVIGFGDVLVLALVVVVIFVVKGTGS